MEKLKDLIKRAYARVKAEPVIVSYGGLVLANLLGYFGLELEAELLAAFDSMVVPFLALVTRRKVAPMSKLKKMSPEELIEVILGEEAIERGRHEA